MKKLISVVTAMFIITTLSGCSDKKAPENGMQNIIVDGVTVDIRERDKALEDALGNRFDTMAEDGFLPANDDPATVLLYHTKDIERDDYTGKAYMIYNDRGLPSEHVLVYNNLRTSASFTEYAAAYPGLYFENIYNLDWGNDTVTAIYQLDGEVIRSDQYLPEMEANGFQGGIHAYLMNKLSNGEAKEVIQMLNMFDGEECYYCELTYYAAD